MSKLEQPPKSTQPSVEKAPVRDVKYFRRLPSDILKGVEVPANFLEDFECDIDTFRHKVAEKFPSDLQGLNMDRIASFFDGHELRQAPLVVCPYERREELRAYLLENLGDFNEGEYMGVYVAALDLTIVFRDRKLEAINGGPEITESFIVHEQAHGTNAHHMIRVVEESGNRLRSEMPRHGQATYAYSKESVGDFLEEAFADYVRGLYLTDIGMKRGVLGLRRRTTVTQEGDETELPMSMKYIFKRRDGSPTISPSSSAAMGLEQLLDRDPDLWPAMVEARHHIDGLREVPRRLNAIQPGLYAMLRDNFNAEQLHHQGQGFIHNVLATRAESGTFKIMNALTRSVKALLDRGE